MTLRDGDIRDLQRKMKLEGRPIKTNIFRDGVREYFTNKRNEIVEERKDTGEVATPRDRNLNKPERRRKRI